MSGKNRNLSLTAYDELFQTAEQRQENGQERIQMLPLEMLHPFPNHPFQVRDDAEMEETTRSIAARGVLVPILVRPRPKGGYEIVSGHRRLHASGLAGLKEIPAIVRDMNDDDAAIIMVDSNLQREHILPSEKAFAYKMKLDALKRQGQRTDLTSTQFAQKLSVQIVGDDAGIARTKYGAISA